jgi:hypothetical protein
MANKDIFNNDEGNFKSLQEELRFKIGEQFELNEFHLKTLKSTVINGIEYENYEYIKEDFKTVFGLRLSGNIVLQYNGDILSGVIYTFKEYDFKSLILNINRYLPFERKLDSQKTVLSSSPIFINLLEFCIKINRENDINLSVLKYLG